MTSAYLAPKRDGVGIKITHVLLTHHRWDQIDSIWSGDLSERRGRGDDLHAS